MINVSPRKKDKGTTDIISLYQFKIQLFTKRNYLSVVFLTPKLGKNHYLRNIQFMSQNGLKPPVPAILIPFLLLALLMRGNGFFVYACSILA